MQCIVLKLDLRCCRGCREWMRRKLKRLDGVEQAEVREDEATLTVRGSGFDEREIVRQVRRRKGRSKVEVVSRIGHGLADREAGHAGSDKACGVVPRGKAMEPMQGSEVELREGKPKATPPQLKPRAPLLPSPPPAGSVEERRESEPQEELQLRHDGSAKGESVVTERVFPELEGTKIRTRVTTSRNVCTCIRVEETRFLIDRHRHNPTGINPCKLLSLRL